MPFYGALVTDGELGVDVLTWHANVYDVSPDSEWHVPDTDSFVVPPGISNVRVWGQVHVSSITGNEQCEVWITHSNADDTIIARYSEDTGNTGGYFQVYLPIVEVGEGDIFQLCFTHPELDVSISAEAHSFFAIESIEHPQIPFTGTGAVVKLASDLADTDMTGGGYAVHWTAEVYDEASCHDNSVDNDRLYVPADATFARAYAQIGQTNATNAGNLIATIEFGGSWYSGAWVSNIDAGHMIANIFGPVIPVTTGTYARVILQTTIDNATGLDASKCWFAIEKIPDEV